MTNPTCFQSSYRVVMAPGVMYFHANAFNMVNLLQNGHSG
jgi:hypothetical protein